jgi:hypothetical protein
MGHDNDRVNPISDDDERDYRTNHLEGDSVLSKENVFVSINDQKEQDPYEFAKKKPKKVLVDKDLQAGPIKVEPDDDEISYTSSKSGSAMSASALEDVIISVRIETNRRRNRLLKFKLALQDAQKDVQDDDDSPNNNKNQNQNIYIHDYDQDHHDTKQAKKQQEQPRLKGIMIVKTLQESLHGNDSVTNMRKRRRRIYRKLITNIDSSQHGQSLDDNSSQVSSLTGLTNCSSMRTNVSFCSISVREFPLAPGDNPSVSDGPPITLEWDHSAEYNDTVDNFECMRLNCRRRPNQMKVPQAIRIHMLVEFGHSLRNIQNAMKAAALSREERLQTMMENFEKDVKQKRKKTIQKFVKSPFAMFQKK